MLCGMLDSTLFQDADDRLITGQSPSYDGVVLIAGNMLSYSHYSSKICLRVLDLTDVSHDYRRSLEINKIG